MKSVSLLNATIKNMQWFRCNYKLIQKQYPGELIAIYNKQIIAHALDYDQIISELKKKGMLNNTVLIKRILPMNQIVIY